MAAATKRTTLRREEPVPRGPLPRDPAQEWRQLCKGVHQKQRLLSQSPPFFQGGRFPRYVYVDLDNVWVSFLNAHHIVERFPGVASTRELQLDLEGFARRLAIGEAGSTVARMVLFYFNTPESIAAKLRSIQVPGVQWDVRKQETTTDTTMQLELLNAKCPCAAHRKTLVLVTGDGNVAPNSMCFRYIVDMYLIDGWFVEVHAWLSTMARAYIDFQREYPSTVMIRPLDDDQVGEIVQVRPRQRAEKLAQPMNKPMSASKPVRSAPVATTPKVVREKRDTTAKVERRREMPAHGRPEIATYDFVRVGPKVSAKEAQPTPQPKRVHHSFSVEQYSSLIRQLEGDGGDMFVPSALEMLRRCGAIGYEHTMIDDVDIGTQHLLVLNAMHEQLDLATRRELQRAFAEPV